MKKLISIPLIAHRSSLIAILASCFLFLVSCKKQLEIEQKMNLENDKALTSAKDLEAVLVGAYNGLHSGNVFGGNMVVYSEFYGDDTEVNDNKLFNFGTREIYNRATTVQLDPLRSMWAESYSSINRTNNVIAAIDGGTINSSDYTAQKANQYKGEALFIRAAIHFEILRFWALPYDVDKPGQNSQLGLPYRTQPTLNGFADLAMARNSVEDVYSKVIADLLLAENLLNKAGYIPENSSRASAAACDAYLARVYFQKGDYNNAAFYANKLINGTQFKLNNIRRYQDLRVPFQTEGDNTSKEVIWQLINIKTDQTNALAYNFETGNDGTVPLFYSCSEAFKTLFNPSDLRSFGYVNTYLNQPRKYVYAVSTSGSVKLFPNVCLLRLAEMYLIAAEADISSYNFNFNEAFDYWNTIVYNRSAGTLDYSTYKDSTFTKTQLLDSIRLERRRELCFEGDRYHNLQRMRQPLRNGVQWNDPTLLFKIPQEEMSGNPLMVQNP